MEQKVLDKAKVLLTNLIELHQKHDFDSMEIIEGEAAKDFEATHHLEDELMSLFGMRDYTELHSIPNFLSLENIPDTLKSLADKATEYLLTNAGSKKDVLLKAKDNQDDALSVLKELNVLHHTYSIFLFTDLFLKDRITADGLLLEFEKLNYEHYNDLGRIEFLAISSVEREQLIEKLKGVCNSYMFVEYLKEIERNG